MNPIEEIAALPGFQFVGIEILGCVAIASLLILKNKEQNYIQFNFFYYLSYMALLMLSSIMNSVLLFAFFSIIYYVAYKSFETLNIIGQPAKISIFGLYILTAINIMLFNQLYHISYGGDLLQLGIGVFSLLMMNIIIINHSTGYIAFKIRSQFLAQHPQVKSTQ